MAFATKFNNRVNSYKKELLERLGAQRKERSCLKCSRIFYSHGPGNRICPRCNGNFSKSNGYIPVEEGRQRQNGDGEYTGRIHKYDM